MAETLDELPEGEGLEETVAALRRRWPRVLAVIGVVFLAALAFLMVTKDDIVDNIVGKQMRLLGLPGTYKLQSTGIPRQVLTNVVIGDAAHPDLTIERVEITIAPRFGFPVISEVKLVRPRIYGTYLGGKLSFGSLDKALFGGASKAPFNMPDLNVTIVDGRGRMVSDFGQIGVKIQGTGNMRSGFAGELAALAPALAAGGCGAQGASVYGKLTTSGGRPTFAGPLRLAAVDCAAQGLHVRQAAVQANATLDPAFDGGDGKFVFATGPVDAQGIGAAQSVAGPVELAYRKAELTARYNLSASNASTPQMAASALKLSGILRARQAFANLAGEGAISGSDLRPGSGLGQALASAQNSAKGSFAEPLLAQLRAGLARQTPGSRFKADYIVRRSAGTTSLLLPQGTVTGGTGETVLAVSRLQAALGNGQPLRLTGNFTTGGAGIPRITGRMEQQARGTTLIRIAMAEYAAGGSKLALPDLVLAQAANGTLGFTGHLLASGALPGGRVEGLDVPIDGRWEPGRGYEVWRGCRDVRFSSLTYAKLTLDRRAIALCPTGGEAILTSRGGALAIGASTPNLDLVGKLGNTPVRIASGPLAISRGGRLAAKGLSVTFGAGEAVTKLTFADLGAVIGREITGTFSGGAGAIQNVPLDMQGASGTWRYAGGKLAVSGLALTVLDQAQVDRFHPLVANDATVELVGNRIAAHALLREPASQRLVTEVTITHDLASARGNALLAVPGIAFDNKLQPDTISPLLLGVVANVHGIVSGEGRIDWNGRKVTSTGRFGSKGLDLAAAFGPAKAVSGTVEFTDLLGLVTAPDQVLKLGSINPGIEANDGLLTFAIKPGLILAVNGARWPFLDGTMRLLPTHMTLGQSEVRSYILEVEGVSAARFVEKMQLANLSATGLFDGKLPLVFDQNGGKIVGGHLVSRSPGGNVSYV
ncbi:MAG: YdbH domain-containing protein, partial [Novosphingobium sp.]